MRSFFKNKSQSFSARLSRHIVFVAALLLVILMVVAALISYKLLTNEAIRSAQNRLDTCVKTIEGKLAEVEGAVNSLAWLVREHKDDPDYCYRIVGNFVSETPNIVGSAIAFPENRFPGMKYCSPYAYRDSEGKVAIKQLGSESYDYFCYDWYQIPVLLGRPCWSEPYFDEDGGNMQMSTYSYPVMDEDGQLVAVLTADISLADISEFLSRMKPYSSSRIALISKCGAYVNVKAGQMLGETVFSTARQLDDPKIMELTSRMISGEAGESTVGRGMKSRMVVYAPTKDGWTVSMVTDYSEILRNASKSNNGLVILAVLGLIVLFIACYRLIRKLTRPLAQITESANSIAEGNFNTELPDIKSNDEIRKLRDTFEYMQKSLSEYIDKLTTTTSANARFESELNIASKIQMSMLPKNFPDHDIVDLFATIRPAKEVGGDLYDFFIKDDVFYFTVGDVSGKGVPASMYMAIARSAFHFMVGLESSVDKIVSQMNRAFCEGNESGLFVTLFAGKVDLKTRKFEYCNAGHNPIVVVDPEDGARYVKAKPNLALGVFGDFVYQKEEMLLRKGTRFVIYTDGVTEAERADKQQFGEDRLLDWCNGSGRFTSAEEACGDLMNKLHDFVEGNEQNDDITIMTIKIN